MISLIQYLLICYRVHGFSSFFIKYSFIWYRLYGLSSFIVCIPPVADKDFWTLFSRMYGITVVNLIQKAYIPYADFTEQHPFLTMIMGMSAYTGFMFSWFCYPAILGEAWIIKPYIYTAKGETIFINTPTPSYGDTQIIDGKTYITYHFKFDPLPPTPAFLTNWSKQPPSAGIGIHIEFDTSKVVYRGTPDYTTPYVFPGKVGLSIKESDYESYQTFEDPTGLIRMLFYNGGRSDTFRSVTVEKRPPFHPCFLPSPEVESPLIPLDYDFLLYVLGDAADIRFYLLLTPLIFFSSDKCSKWLKSQFQRFNIFK